MADDPRFFLARAAEERANAERATLDNVRQRCDRAALAWEQMAERSARTNAARIQRDAETAERSARGAIAAPVDALPS